MHKLYEPLLKWEFALICLTTVCVPIKWTHDDFFTCSKWHCNDSYLSPFQLNFVGGKIQKKMNINYSCIVLVCTICALIFFRHFLELWGTSVVGFAVAVAEFAFRLMEIYSVVCHQTCSLTLLEQQWAGCQQLLKARRTSFTKASSDLHSALLAVMAMLFCCHAIHSLCCFMCVSAHVQWWKPNCGLQRGSINIDLGGFCSYIDSLSHKERKEQRNVRQREPGVFPRKPPRDAALGQPPATACTHSSATLFGQALAVCL